MLKYSVVNTILTKCSVLQFSRWHTTFNSSLASFTGLISLDLENCGYLTSPGLHSVAVNCTQLQELNIQGTRGLSDDSIEHVLLSKKGRLRKLCIEGYMLRSSMVPTIFLGLGSSLEHLSISPGMWQISPELILEHLPGVKYLKIVQIYEPFKLLKCPNLEELFLIFSDVEMSSSTVDLDTVVQCFSLHTLCLVKVDG